MKKTVVIIRNANWYDFGGGERFPVFLADVLRNNGYEPLVVSRSEKLLSFAKSYTLSTVRGWWWARQNWSGARTLLFPLYFLWQCALTVWYLQLFIRTHAQIIHIQGKDDFIAATIAGKLTGARVIWTDHADLKYVWENLHVWYKNPVGKLVHFASRFADTITAVSKSEHELIRARLRPTDPLLTKIHVIYNGVIEKTVIPAPLAGQTFRFCVANRLVTSKGIGEVIMAFIQLEKTHPNSELLLLGDGPEAEKFKKMAATHPSIQFLGHQENPLQYMASSDVFVQPTYHEGFSVALVEASMLGRPIIATAAGGNVEIIHDGKTGLLVPPKDAAALQSAMEKLLEDGALRKKLGTNAHKQYEERFNFATIVAREFIPLYEGGKIT